MSFCDDVFYDDAFCDDVPCDDVSCNDATTVDPHEELFERLDEVRAAMRAGYDRAEICVMLDALGDRCERDFAEEERRLQQTDPSRVEAVRRANAELLDVLRSVRQLYEAVGSTRKLKVEVCRFLNECLTEHVGRIESESDGRTACA